MSHPGGSHGLLDDVRFAFSYDDVLLVPQHSTVLPSEADLSVVLADGIRLAVPVLAAAMDTVCEAPLAVGLARAGGLGVIHRNLAVSDQADEVKAVKRAQAAIISDPATTSPDTDLSSAAGLMSALGISALPVCDRSRRLCGILTRRDVRFAPPAASTVADAMTADVVCGTPATTPSEAARMFREHRIEKLPLVDSYRRLVGLICAADLRLPVEHPDATRDSSGRLQVGAAVGCGPAGLERAGELVAAGVDLLVVDSAHGHSHSVVETVATLRRSWPEMVVAAGNVATAAGATALADAGAHVVKVGVGPGSICTTRVVCGVGVPQLSAVAAATAALEGRGVRVIADGGVRGPADAAKAFAVGAAAVMAGGLLAGCSEAPGATIVRAGERFRAYRGMGSAAAVSLRSHSRDRYGHPVAAGPGDSGDAGAAKAVAEGVEAAVPVKGPVAEVVAELAGGLRQAMGYVGARTLSDLAGTPMVRVSPAGLVESFPHDLAFITSG